MGNVMTRTCRKATRRLVNFARGFIRARRGNVAVIFALSLIPLAVAAGSGLDYSRAVVARSSMSAALDAAALAVGKVNSKPASCTASSTDSACTSLKAIATQYFLANYTYSDSANQKTAATGAAPDLVMTIANESVTLTVDDKVPTQVVKWILPSIPINGSSTVVWGQTKLWVALVLDNTGSMTQTDSTGTSKISALKTASKNLLTILQSASSTAGDVQASIVPFSKDVNVGTSNVNASWIDWTDWSAEPKDSNGNYDPPATGLKGYIGPGDSCPYTKSSDGFVCVKSPGSATSTSTIPSSGSYSGYICPGVMQTYNASTGTGGHYFNGCYTSAKDGNSKQVSSGKNASCSGYANCSCTGTKNNTVCSASEYKYTWAPFAHSTWTGCLEDRTQSYDVQDTAPASGSLFPAENSDNCVGSTITTLGYDWTSLSNQITAMVANGSTNQTVGLAHGWMTLTSGSPYNAPTLPPNTTRYIILVSDGLNTQDRWNGDGTNESTAVNDRMALACTNAKADGIVVYTIFIDLGGTQGNSKVLQTCATDSTKYFDLTTSNAIITTFNDIAQQITNLRVSQ